MSVEQAIARRRALLGGCSAVDPRVGAAGETGDRPWSSRRCHSISEVEVNLSSQ